MTAKPAQVSTVQIVWYFVRRHQGMFVGLGLLSIVVGVLEAISLGAFLPILYALLGTESGPSASQGHALIVDGIRRVVAFIPIHEPFLAACALLVVLTVVKAALALLHEYLTANLTGRLLHRYRIELIQRLSSASLHSIEEARIGALVHDLIQPPIMLARLLYTLPRLMVDFLRTVFVLGLLVYVEPLVSMGLAAMAAILYLAFSRRLSVYLYQIGLKRRSVELTMNSAANEWLHGIRTIRIGGADSHWLDGFTHASRTAQSTYIRSFFLLSSPRHLFELFGFLLLIIALMLAYGLDPVGFKGHVVVIGIFAVGMVRILPSAAALVRGPLDIRNTIPDIQHIYEVLNAPPSGERSGTASYQSFQEAIRLVDVSVEYGGGAMALSGVNLRIPRGKVVALVGSSGSGKTTLLNTLIGIQPASRGHVWFDQQEVGSLDLRSLLDHVGYVGQRISLFHGTIAQNIAFFHKDVSAERIEVVARLAKIDEFVDSLPKRYQTLVGEGGANLSGGQAQRIAIARALLNNPEILVLDEPTSALDSTSEAYVLESLQQASKDRTAIMVTHKLSSVRWADRIIVLDHGSVVAEGGWNELAQGDGLFRNMCREQNLLP